MRIFLSGCRSGQARYVRRTAFDDGRVGAMIERPAGDFVLASKPDALLALRVGKEAVEGANPAIVAGDAVVQADHHHVPSKKLVAVGPGQAVMTRTPCRGQHVAALRQKRTKAFDAATPTTMSDRSFDTPELVVRGILRAFDLGKAVAYPGRPSVPPKPRFETSSSTRAAIKPLSRGVQACLPTLPSKVPISEITVMAAE